MFKQGLYQLVPSVKVSLVGALWLLGVALVSIGVLCTAPGA